MSKNKVVKSISFNVTNEKDQEFLKRIENVNFSQYVKRLIEKDIKSRKVIRAENRPLDNPDVDGRVSGPIMTKGANLTLISV